MTKVNVVVSHPRISDVSVDRRRKTLDLVERPLSEQGRSASEMQDVIERSGASFEEVAAEFEDTDEVFLAVIERVYTSIAA